MATYLITGGFGFLGQHIVKALHDHDPDAYLRVLGRTERSTFLGVEKLERVRWVQGDLSKPETFEDELHGVDVIIHNAAMVSFSKSDTNLIYEANVVGTRNLSQAALGAGCKNFVFISSISAVGRKKGQISDESMYPDAEYSREHNMYGYSKMVSEADLVKLKDQMRIIMLNPSLVLGPGSDRIEATFRIMRFLPIFPMLSYINSFVDAHDVAQAVVLSLTKGHSGERYIVTAHNEEMLEFMRLAAGVMGKNPLILPVSSLGLRALDGIVRTLDFLKLKSGIRLPSAVAVDKPYSSEKIGREMGWEPTYTLENSIIDSIS